MDLMKVAMKKLALPMVVGMVALLASCAKQGYPSGGPRDVAPPEVVGMHPASGTTHFNDRSFSITFNEFVVLNDAENNIIISPPLQPKPQYTLKGKSLVVELPDTLKSDATYLFQMHGAIADFTEGNRIGPLEYAFSTGGTIDILSLQGRVLDAYKDKPYAKTVTVMLYRQQDGVEWDDSTIALQQPDYVARCDEKGAFRFNYIADGQYRIAAIDDADRNLRYNGDEAVAFLDTLIHPTLAYDSTPSIDTLHPPLTLLISCDSSQRKQRVTKSDFVGTSHILVTTAAPMLSPQVMSDDSLLWRVNDGGDSLTVWLRRPGCDSTVLILRDTSGLDDTLRLQLRKKKTGRKHYSNTTADTLAATKVRFLFGQTAGVFDTLFLASDNPIVGCADTALQLLALADSSRHTARLRFDSLGLRAYIDTLLPAGKYQCTLVAGGLTDLWGGTNSKREASIEVKDADQYGNIILTYRGLLPTNTIVQLTNEQGKVLSTKPWPAETTRLAMEHLAPGKYRIQAFSDLDGNGKWTAGNYWLHRQPETIYHFEKTLQVRENWDIEETWQLTQ